MKGTGSETEVTWEDQLNINRFSNLNNRSHELEDEIKAAKVRIAASISCCFLDGFFPDLEGRLGSRDSLISRVQYLLQSLWFIMDKSNGYPAIAKLIMGQLIQ